MQDIVVQLQRFVNAMSKYHSECLQVMKEADIFPIEVDLSRQTFTYDQSGQFNDVDDEDEEGGEEVTNLQRPYRDVEEDDNDEKVSPPLN